MWLCLLYCMLFDIWLCVSQFRPQSFEFQVSVRGAFCCVWCLKCIKVWKTGNLILFHILTLIIISSYNNLLTLFLILPQPAINTLPHSFLFFQMRKWWQMTSSPATSFVFCSCFVKVIITVRMTCVSGERFNLSRGLTQRPKANTDILYASSTYNIVNEFCCRFSELLAHTDRQHHHHQHHHLHCGLPPPTPGAAWL